MTSSDGRSRQNSMPKSLATDESIIKGDQFQVSRDRKRRQISIRPDVGGIRIELREVAPNKVNTWLFVQEVHSLVSLELVIDFPCLFQTDGLGRKCFPVGQQSKKAHLRHATEVTSTSRNRLNPSRRYGVVSMRFSSECKPNVDVRKLYSRHSPPLRFFHLRVFGESFHWSDTGCRARLNQSVEISSVSGLPTNCCSTLDSRLPRQSRWSLRATRGHRRRRYDRSEHVLQV
jgi:hypothetical protein